MQVFGVNTFLFDLDKQTTCLQQALVCYFRNNRKTDGRTDIRKQKTENRNIGGGGYKCTYTVAVQKVAQKLAS